MENFGSVLPAAKGDGVVPIMIGDQAQSMVAAKDIGAAAAKALLDGKTVDIIELEGPRYTPGDVAAAFADALGRPVNPVAVPFEAQAPTLQSFGLSENVASLFAEMNAGIARGHVDFDGAGTRLRGDTSLAEVVRGFVA